MLKSRLNAFVGRNVSSKAKHSFNNIVELTSVVKTMVDRLAGALGGDTI